MIPSFVIMPRMWTFMRRLRADSSGWPGGGISVGAGEAKAED